jgi:DNA ligase OB-like domain
VANVATRDLKEARIWAAQSEWITARVKFKYQSLSADGVPRFPVFLGRRDERDE